MRTLFDLKPGDEVQAYMRLSLALEVGRYKDGTPYRFVPGKPQRASERAITRFQGTVIANDVLRGILCVNTAAINSIRRPLSNSINMVAEISYSSFDRVFILSPYSYEPRPEIRRGGNMYRPTTKALGTNYKPYRTLEALHIPPTGTLPLDDIIEQQVVHTTIPLCLGGIPITFNP